MIEGLGEMTQVLADADPKDKAEVYSALGIEVTYRPELRIEIPHSKWTRWLCGDGRLIER